MITVSPFCAFFTSFDRFVFASKIVALVVVGFIMGFVIGSGSVPSLLG
jgi:hypothetical protein